MPLIAKLYTYLLAMYICIYIFMYIISLKFSANVKLHSYILISVKRFRNNELVTIFFAILEPFYMYNQCYVATLSYIIS